MPAPHLWGSLGNLRGFIESYALQGVQQDSVRRQLNRLGVSTADLPWKQLWAESHAQIANARLLSGAHRFSIPKPGAGMVAREFKSPNTYRYVHQITMMDTEGNFLGTTTLSLNSDRQLRVWEAEKIMKEKAQAEADKVGRSGIIKGAVVVDSTLINAYYNAAE